VIIARGIGELKNALRSAGGSVGFMIGEIDCDVLIAGDLKYHDAIKAKTLGIGVIDAGHYETERFLAKF
jgi:putative NIF3 family GTP cyclohydrolase 1 type 2